MPYEIRDNCVYKVGEPEPMKCYDNKDDALAYLGALEANVSDATTKAGRVLSRKNEGALMNLLRGMYEILRGAGAELSFELEPDEEAKQTKAVELYAQEEVGYVTESPNDPPVMCASCRWYVPPMAEGERAACHLVKAVPEPIVPQGWCDKYEAAPEDVDYEEGKSTVVYATPTPIKSKHFGLFTREQTTWKLLRSPSGRRMMIQVTSNNYEDRDGEIVSKAALEQYVESQWDGATFKGDQVQLFWHHPDLPIGDILWAGMIDGFLVEVFEEQDTPVAKATYDYIEANPDAGWASSHGFKFSDVNFDGKIYRRIKKFETSVLPREYAANIWTYAGVV